MNFKALLLVLGFTFTNKAFAAEESILDYYLEIPDGYLSVTADSDGHILKREEKLDAIKIKDVSRGFLLIDSEKINNKFTLAIFKNSKKENVLGIIEDGASVQRGPSFFIKKSANWVDVTKDVFPNIDLRFVLESYKSKDAGKKDLTEKDLKTASHSPVRYSFSPGTNRIDAFEGLLDDGVSQKKLFSLVFDGKKFVIKK